MGSFKVLILNGSLENFSLPWVLIGRTPDRHFSSLINGFQLYPERNVMWCRCKLKRNAAFSICFVSAMYAIMEIILDLADFFREKQSRYKTSEWFGSQNHFFQLRQPHFFFLCTLQGFMVIKYKPVYEKWVIALQHIHWRCQETLSRSFTQPLLVS